MKLDDIKEMLEWREFSTDMQPNRVEVWRNPERKIAILLDEERLCIIPAYPDRILVLNNPAMAKIMVDVWYKHGKKQRAEFKTINVYDPSLDPEQFLDKLVGYVEELLREMERREHEA